MNNIYNAFNVQNEFELTKLIESFDLNNEEETELYSSLNESMSVDGIRYIITELTKKYDNGSYEKLQEQLSKQPFKRTLKEDATHYDLKNLWKDIVQQYRDLGYGDFDDDDLVRIYNNVYGFLSAVSNEFWNTDKPLDSDADSIGTYYDDEVVKEFRREVRTGYINYFGDYDNYEDMLENGSMAEMFEALMSQMKKELVERLVNDVNNFIQENENELFNPNFDEPKKAAQPEDNGDKDWLEEAANEKEAKFIRINNLMKEVNRCLMDCRDGKIFEEIANNEDDSEDNLLDEIGGHMCNLLLRLSEAHYVPAELEILDINPYIKKQAEELMNWEEWLDENIQSEEDFKDWLNTNLQERRYYGIFQAMPIDGKFNCCQVIYKSMKLMYNTFINSDYYSELTAQPPKESGEEFMESYDVNKEPIFDIGDNVSFKWGDKEITGRVINTKKIGSNEYFDIISWNNEKKRRETYTTVCPVSNEMKKISEGEI